MNRLQKIMPAKVAVVNDMGSNRRIIVHQTARRTIQEPLPKLRVTWYTHCGYSIHYQIPLRILNLDHIAFCKRCFLREDTIEKYVRKHSYRWSAKRWHV